MDVQDVRVKGVRHGLCQATVADRVTGLLPMKWQ